MKNQDYTTSFMVDQTPKESFNAINNVCEWWLDEIDGNSQKPDDEFSVHFWDVHYSEQKITEFIPNTKVV